jgi:predicted transposase/invertase (TIGR01784 family)
MKQKVQHLHDKIVKETFSRPEIAKAYFKKFLPQELIVILDIDSLSLVNGSFITDELKDLFADLLFQFKLKDREDDLIISLLFEHKAQPDKQVLLQVGNYLFNQWSKEIKAKQELIPIIPFIYYQGKKKWSIPSIAELFGRYPAEIKSYLPSFNYIFFAINSLTKEQLNTITDTMLYIALLGHDPKVDIKSFLKQIIDIQSLKRLEEVDRNFINLIFVYKTYNSDISNEEVVSIIKELANPINDDFMSTYDSIKMAGRQEGRQEGEQIGIEKGKIEVKTEVVLALYRDNIPIEQIAKYTVLSVEDVVKIIRSRK